VYIAVIFFTSSSSSSSSSVSFGPVALRASGQGKYQCSGLRHAPMLSVPFALLLEPL
jgi:hypothetical protein